MTREVVVVLDYGESVGGYIGDVRWVEEAWWWLCVDYRWYIGIDRGGVDKEGVRRCGYRGNRLCDWWLRLVIDGENWDGDGEGLEGFVGKAGISASEIYGGWSRGGDGEGVETGLEVQEGARAIAGDTVLNALVEDEGDEVGRQFVEAMVDDGVIGGSHLEEVAVVGAAIEVGGL